MVSIPKSTIFNTNAYNVALVIFVAISTIASAYGLAIIGSTVGQPSFYKYFGLAVAGEPGYRHTSNMIGALNGVNSGGAVVGALFQAWSSDYYGRKYTLLIGCVVLIVGGALNAGSVNMGMFIAGRTIAGAGSAILTTVVPIYQAEVSTAETRGAMVAVTGIMYAVGYSLSGWLGYACYFTPDNVSWSNFAWRFPLAVQCLFPLIVLIGANYIPFSPRWLLSKGRREEAWHIVRKLHHTKEDVNDIQANQEFYMMEKQFEHDRAMLTRRFEIFRTKPNLRRAATAFMLMWGDQFLAVFVLANYGVLIYGYLGFSGAVPLLMNACWDSFTLIGNTWTALYVDRVGRRTCLLIGSTGCICCLIFEAALTAEYAGTTFKPGLRAAVFFVFFYIFWWCFFMDATQFVYLSEIFPNHLRSQGVALGMIAFYLSSEIVLVATPVAMVDIGWRFYLVFIVPSFFYILIIYFFFPETKGRTLEEIGALFGDEANVVTHWHDLPQEERDRITQEALKMTHGENGENGEKGEREPTTLHEDKVAQP